MPAATINGQQYEVSPLKLKHLRQITQMIVNAPKNVYETIDRWVPFIIESIKTKNPSFTQEMMEEATLQEIVDAWAVVAESSGIKIINKTGEVKPTETSTGSSSTGDSAPLSAGAIVQ